MTCFFWMLFLFSQLAISQEDFFEESMKYKSSEQFDKAILELELLLIHEPSNIQALEQRALMLGWRQEYSSSIQMWKKVIALQPQNLKYKMNLARVLFWSGDYKTSIAYLDEVLTREPGNKDATELREKVATAKPRKKSLFRMDVGGSLDNFSAVRESESSVFLQAGMKVDSQTDVFLRFDNQNQFKTTDQALGVGAYYKIDSDWLLNADYTTALKTPNFRAKTILNLGLENFSLNPVSLSMGYRSLSFMQGNVSIFQPGVQWSDYGFTVQFKYGLSQNIDKTSTSSSQIKFDYSLTESTSVGVGYASGEEALPPLAKARVNYSTVGLQHQFDDQHAVRLDYVLEDRINVYKHQSIGFSYAYKF